MIFEFRNAPMHYVDDIPAFKAGEWAGKLSCKFKATRKVIRPMTEGIIFNENEPPIIPKKRLLSLGPSKEYQFKPCLKMVKPETDMKSKKEGIRVCNPSFSDAKERPEKKHYFAYRQEHVRELQMKEQENDNKVVLNDEFRVLNKIGFSKKTLESLPNNKLLGVNFSKDYSTYTFNFNTAASKSDNAKSKGKVHLEKAAKSMWQLKEQDQFNNIRLEKENIRKDVDYVRTLDNWEKSFLPKLK